MHSRLLGLAAAAGAVATTVALATPALAAGTVAAVSRVGDRDNFGFGMKAGAPPCLFFDNRGPKDLPGFDQEAADGSDANTTWTHTFTPVADATRVQLAVWEEFSDYPGASGATVDIDGTTMPLVKDTATPSGCNAPAGGVKRYIQLRGAAAQAAAADGSVTVTLHENGDDVALDRAVLTVYTG